MALFDTLVQLWKRKIDRKFLFVWCLFLVLKLFRCFRWCKRRGKWRRKRWNEWTKMRAKENPIVTSSTSNRNISSPENVEWERPIVDKQNYVSFGREKYYDGPETLKLFIREIIGNETRKRTSLDESGNKVFPYNFFLNLLLWQFQGFHKLFL